MIRSRRPLNCDVPAKRPVGAKTGGEACTPVGANTGAKAADGAKTGAKLSVGAKPGGKAFTPVGAKTGAKAADGAKTGAKLAVGAKTGAKLAFGASSEVGAKRDVRLEDCSAAKSLLRPRFSSCVSASFSPSSIRNVTRPEISERRGGWGIYIYVYRH